MIVWSEEWDENQAEGRRRRVAAGETLGATLYELSRGGGIAYHFHHGSEELLIVLRGRVRLRTPEGTRDVTAGDVVHFPVGPDGAHALTNDTDEPARYVMVSTLVSPNATEYPDTRHWRSLRERMTSSARALRHPHAQRAGVVGVSTAGSPPEGGSRVAGGADRAARFEQCSETIRGDESRATKPFFSGR